MKIAIGSDHRGFVLKEEIKEYLEKLNYEYKDFGTYSEESFDYPDVFSEEKIKILPPAMNIFPIEKQNSSRQKIVYVGRLSKTKNTGKIIPGHGGLLDRIDGMIFAFPFSFFLLKIL